MKISNLSIFPTTLFNLMWAHWYRSWLLSECNLTFFKASQYARDEVGEIRRRLRMRTAIRNSKEKSPLSPSLNDPAYSTVAKPLLNASDMTQMRASVPRPNSNLRSSQNRPLFNRSARSHWMKNMKQRNQVTKTRQAINNWRLHSVKLLIIKII